MISTVTSKGQITIPVEIRRAAGLSTGSQVAFVVNRHANIEMIPIQADLRGLRGSLTSGSTPHIATDRKKRDRPKAVTDAEDPPKCRFIVNLKS